MGKKQRHRKKRSAPLIEALEPRMLFSADVFGGALDAPGTDDPLATILHDAAAAVESARTPEAPNRNTENDAKAGPVSDADGVNPVTHGEDRPNPTAIPRHELVVVDTATPDYQRLVDDILAQSDDDQTIEVVLLDARQDGLDQFSEILSGYSGLDAVHLISHGDAGEIHIGNGFVDLATLQAQADLVATLSASFSDEGDLLIYGCDLASTAEGEVFVDTLAQLTGADVAASVDLTGSSDKGGDWDLEYKSGKIESSVALSHQTQEAWDELLVTYTVTSTADDGSPGTLRWAIDQSNATSTVDDIIDFNIAGIGPHVISLGSALPTLTDTVTIDGWSEPDYSNQPVVRIDGNSAGGSTSGITVASTADGTMIRGLMITDFTADGIRVESGADFVTIAGNWIGTAGTGTAGVGNGDDGIDLRGLNATIGGTGTNEGNVITNAGDEGVDIVGSGVTNHVIQGNIIGLDPDGATGLGNADVGIAIISGSGNTIGGVSENARNIISNNYEGIEINTDDNVVQGNYIGTDATGNLDRGNRSDDGIEIQSNANGNLIGGTDPGAGNLIAYNALDGVNIVSGSNNAVLGNEIQSNGDLAIDLGAGANGTQTAPVLATAAATENQIIVTGSLTSAANDFYRIEFFASTGGGNQTYLGYANVATDGAGNTTINATLTANVTVGASISATATNSDASYTTFTDSSELGANIVAVAANDAPSFGISNNPTYIEDGSAVVLDSEVTIFDAELSVADDFGGASLTLVRNGGASADDVYSATGTLNVLTQGGSLVVDSTTIGTVTNNSAGTLVLTFNSNATNALVNSAIQKIAYSNSNDAPPANVQIDWSFDDGNSGAQGSGGALQGTGSITVTVNPINDDPTNTGSLPTDVVVTEDTPGFVDLSSINFEDVDAGNNLIQVTLSTSNGGVLTASSDFDVTVFGSGFSTMTLQGGVSDLNNFFSSAFRFQYSNPTTHLAGDNVDTIQITVNDLGNIGSGGGTNIDFGTINVDITNVNDAPAGTDKTVATNEDNAYTFTTVDFGFSDTNDSPSDVLANILITTAPSNGSLYVDVNDDGLIDGGETLAATDTVALADITASLLKFKPLDNSNGMSYDSFTFQVQDDGGTINSGVDTDQSPNTITIDVIAVTDLSAVDDDFSNNEDIALNADVSTNDSTTSEGSLSYAVDTDVSNGTLVLNGDGSFTYTSDANYTGADSFTYTVTDADSGESSIQTVNLTVDPVTDLTAQNDSFSTSEDTVLNADVSSNDSTTSGGSLSYVVDTDVSNGTLVLNGDGTFSYTPDSNYTGSDSFTYMVTDADSSESDTRTVSLTVDPVTDLFAADDSFTANEDTALNADVSTNDSTTSGGSLSYTVDTDVSNGSLVLNGDGSFTYTPDANYTGSDSFSYTVTDADSGESSTQTVNLTVDPVADLSATDDAFSTIEETVLDADVSTNDSTTSGGSLSYAVDTDVSNGTLVLNGDGSFIYTPDSNYTGSDSFSYTVTDADSGESSTQTVSLTVNPVADLSAVNDAFSTNEDTLLNADVSTNDSTTSGGSLSYAVDTDVSNGTLVFNGDGSFTYTPDANYTGADSFTYTVTDVDGGESSTQTVSLTVDPVANLSATDDSFSTHEDTVLNADVSTNDSTTSGGSLSYALDTNASNGTVVVNANGTFTYTPDTNFNGFDSFTYTVTDTDSGESSTQTVNIVLTAVDDGPVISGDNAGALTEDIDPDFDTVLETSGTLLVTDPDRGESSFQEESIVGTYGNLSIGTAGNWSYIAENTQAAIQQLDTGEILTDILTVTTADGTTHDINITINGAEDAPVITGITSGTVAWDGTITAKGFLAISDVDTNDNPMGFPNQESNLGDNGYGSFVLTEGSWTYTLNNAAVQHLGPGQSVTDTITYTAMDGVSSITVTITINGAEEAPLSEDARTNTEIENGTDEVSDQVDDAANASEVLEEEASEHRPINSGLQSATEDSVWEEEPDVSRGEPIALPPLDDAALVSILTEVRQDSESKGNSLNAHTPITPKFIDLNHLDIAPFVLESPDPTDLQSIRDNDSFVASLEELDHSLDEAIEEEENQPRIEIESVIGLTLSLSAGFVAWVFRAGSLLASFMSVLPLWRQFDPLPILDADAVKRRAAHEDQNNAEKVNENTAVETIFDDEKSG